MVRMWCASLGTQRQARPQLHERARTSNRGERNNGSERPPPMPMPPGLSKKKRGTTHRAVVSSVIPPATLPGSATSEIMRRVGKVVVQAACALATSANRAQQRSPRGTMMVFFCAKSRKRAGDRNGYFSLARTTRSWIP